MMYLIAIALATITSLTGYILPLYKALDLYGILLVLNVGAYLGFAITDGRRDKIVLEGMVALGFGMLVLVGMWRWPWLIAAGFFLHAVWDLLHHPLKLGARVRRGYATACLLYDVLVGGFIYLHLLR